MTKCRHRFTLMRLLAASGLCLVMLRPTGVHAAVNLF